MARARGSSLSAAARALSRFTKRVTSRYRANSVPSIWKSTVCGMRLVKIGAAPQVPSARCSGK